MAKRKTKQTTQINDDFIETETVDNSIIKEDSNNQDLTDPVETHGTQDLTEEPVEMPEVNNATKAGKEDKIIMTFDNELIKIPKVNDTTVHKVHPEKEYVVSVDQGLNVNVISEKKKIQKEAVKLGDLVVVDTHSEKRIEANYEISPTHNILNDRVNSEKPDPTVAGSFTV